VEDQHKINQTIQHTNGLENEFGLFYVKSTVTFILCKIVLYNRWLLDWETVKASSVPPD